MTLAYAQVLCHTRSMTIKAIKTRRRTDEEVRIDLERRRSNIARPHRNKSKYSRKPKYKGNYDD
jgi:hypothetical protein